MGFTNRFMTTTITADPDDTITAPTTARDLPLTESSSDTARDIVFEWFTIRLENIGLRPGIARVCALAIIEGDAAVGSAMLRVATGWTPTRPKDIKSMRRAVELINQRKLAPVGNAYAIGKYERAKHFLYEENVRPS